MGNSSSRSFDNNVFKTELTTINNIVTNIINEQDLFINSKYNFLSQDVCNKYQVVLEEELNKHLKIDIKALGTALYLIPKNDETKLTNFNITKKEVCEKISNHYLKILYIITLIKYVYNIENNGDLSIAGIVLRNIRLLDDVMEVNFCDIKQVNYYNKTGDKKRYKIDFSNLEGFKFFVDFFLEKSEANAFLGVLKGILARSSKGDIKNRICNYQDNFNQKELHELQQLYLKRYNEKLICNSSKGKFKSNHIPAVTLDVFINKNNPIFSHNYCSSMKKLIIKTNTKEGREVMNLYKELKKNYDVNIANLETALNKLIVHQKDNKVSLKDIDKSTLDQIIFDVKTIIKVFYLQSIVDYQRLLDKAKLVPNIDFGFSVT
jgi:hypothetical protein